MNYVDTKRNQFCKCNDITTMILIFRNGDQIPICRDCIGELFLDQEVLMSVGADEVYEVIKDDISTYE